MEAFRRLVDFLLKKQVNEVRKASESRGFPRFIPEFEHRLEINGHSAGLLDISRSGIRADIGEEINKPGDEVTVRLFLRSATLRTEGRIAWQKSGIAGIQFLKPETEFVRALDTILRPQYLGESLREVSPDYVKTKSDGKLRWWQGAGDTNIFVWTVNEKISQFQIIFLSYAVEWGGRGVVKTGELTGERIKAGFGRSDPYFVVYSQVPDSEVLRNAQILLKSSGIEAEIRGFILNEMFEMERRLFVRLPVSDVFLFCSEKTYKVNELSFNGFRLESDDPESGEGLLLINGGQIRVRIAFRRIHDRPESGGYEITDVVSEEQSFVEYLRKRSIEE